MKIAVAGGKGGTGKTLVATALAVLLSEGNDRVAYCDADAEGPNGRLLLHPVIERVVPLSVHIPVLNAPNCSGCGECQSVCAFSAILVMGKQVTVFPELCHSCEACFIACADGMLTRSNRHVGNISEGKSNTPASIAQASDAQNLKSLAFFEASLHVGEARVSPLIDAVVSLVEQIPWEFAIIDNPPGTSCAAVAGQKEANLLILVTEPTPFGLHDLKLSVALGKLLNIPMMVVVNRSDLGDTAEMDAYLAEEQVPVAARIPFDRRIAKLLADGQLPLHTVAAFDEQLALLQEQVLKVKEALA